LNAPQLSVVTLMVARYGLLLMNWMAIVDVDGARSGLLFDELEGDIGVRKTFIHNCLICFIFFL
jgi:hypothetical protein